MVLDLRLLGLWRRIPLASLTTPLVPVAGAAFGFALLTGVCLISANGSEYVGNPFLPIKFPPLPLRWSTWRAWTCRERGVAGKSGTCVAPLPSSFMVAGGVSLAAWLTAVAAGRMIGYW